MIYRSKAPLRIGLAGGGTILNATVSLYAHASIEPLKEPVVILQALDRNEMVELHPDDEVTIDNLLPLHKGVYRRIIIVTNQRGVAKGKMSEERLNEIHAYMLAEIGKKGGRIDAIYYSTALSDEHPDRKPNSGMAYRAKLDFPEISFEKSIMAGDSRSDMEFGKRLEMNTVLIANSNTPPPFPADLLFPSLLDFALSMENQ